MDVEGPSEYTTSGVHWLTDLPRWTGTEAIHRRGFKAPPTIVDTICS